MDIQNPRRILLVGSPDAPILDLLQDLTGSKPTPSPNENGLAGTSHALPLKTAYYTASIPIWIDVPASSLSPAADLPPASTATAPSSTSTSSSTSALPALAPAPARAPAYDAWATSFLDASIPGARDVLSALGAIVVCFRKPSSAAEFRDVKALLAAAARVVQGCKEASCSKDGSGGWDGVCVAVGLRRAVVPGLEVGDAEWEDVCMEEGGGFEWVDGEVVGRGRNEFRELTGIARLKEALEANDWASTEDDFGIDDFGDLEDEESMGFGAEAAELEMEMFGMKRAIYGIGEEDDEGEGGKERGGGKDEEDEEGEVEKLEALMLRMQAVRDMGADLPEAERKSFAAKAVKDIMKTL